MVDAISGWYPFGVLAQAATGAAGAAANSPLPDPGQVQFPAGRGGFGAGGAAAGAVCRAESELIDCEVEGTLPPDLDGAFYRVGPDAQYPKAAQHVNDIPFDGEGHVSMFRIKDGHVDYRSRYAKNQRWQAQREARRALFGMYRNPYTDDPSVAGLSAGTANTQMFFHHGKLMALKEDSPPVVLDPHTLETLDDYYTFGGELISETFTAHPKIDTATGELFGMGFEARGFGTDDVMFMSADASGKVNWRAWVKVPYVGMLHDFAVTRRHILFLVVPLAFAEEQIRNGGVHWAWDSSLPTYLGVMRRGGDGSDVRYFKGPQMMAIHIMGAWSEGDRVFIDMDGADGNQFPFFPGVHEPFDPRKATGQIRRLSADFGDRSNDTFSLEILFPEVSGALSRQDDRFHVADSYRYGWLTSRGPGGPGWAMVDHVEKHSAIFTPGPRTSVSEMCFAPRSADAPEGDGYLMGMVSHTDQGGRSDLLILDTRDILAGPIATVRLPHKAVGQVHGYWVCGDQLPPE
jgi:carotenoid cleavage dioxygenase-like enzyme